MTTDAPTTEGPGLFPPTHWSVVLTASAPDSPQAQAALEILCRAYWHPLHVYVVRFGFSPQDAQDLTQEFFAQLLAKNWLQSADRTKGRLRTFLLVALKKFLSNRRRHESAQKRGGGEVHVPLEDDSTPGAASEAMERAFDRAWALTLLETTLKRLQAEFAALGKADDFEVLKETLTAGHAGVDYAKVALVLDMNAGAARVAVHRLRRRFRETYREEVSRTLHHSGELEAEMQYLASLLV